MIGLSSRGESVVGPSDLRYNHVMSYVLSTPWAILPDKLAVIMDLLAFRTRGGALTSEEIAERISAVSRPQARASASVAVLPLLGVIYQRANLMSDTSGGTSVEQFTRRFRAALADTNVASILIEIDSPGGSVAGVAELADEMFRARGQKPVVAVANSLAASAAYWIGSAADELSVTPSGEVGSIGVIAAHQDMSKAYEIAGVKTTLVSAGRFKGEGNPFEPLTEEARTALQNRVDDYYGMFVGAVAKHRGVSVSDVRGGFGEGRVVGASEAKRLGMADRIETLDSVIQRMTRGRATVKQMGAADRRRLMLSGDHLASRIEQGNES